MCASGLFVSSLFGLLIPWMTREAIDGIAAPDGRERLVRAVSWMLLFAALHGTFRYLSRRGLLVAARRVEFALRRDVFDHVIRLPLSFFSATPTGDVMSRMTNDVSAVWLFLGPGLLMLTGTVISYVLAIGFMLRISILLTVVSLVLAPVIIIVSREYGKRFHRLYRKVQETLARMNATIQENVSGIRLVKAYGLEEKEEGRFAVDCEEYLRRNVSVAKTSAVFHGAIGFLAGAGIALVLMLGGWLVIGGRLTLGGFVAFNAYLAMLSFPTMALGWVINLVQRGGSAMGRINEFIRHPIESAVAESQEDDRASRVSRENGDAGVRRHAPALEFKGLTYAYPGDGRGGVLRDITFSVRPGEVVGLVGPTGGGKSTLLSLILRLYPVPPGAVFFEGRDVNDIPVHLLRRSIAFVAQDPFLFSDTVLSNICFGFAAPDLEAARRAAGQARLLAEIEEMPDGFDTVIGERGISLSGGQKQRATIARALCTGARVLLMDDALSSVDAETEQEIFEEILALRGGRTILFSTHRMSSLSRCDRILVLSGGRIAEEGTHDELLSLRGEYFDLYSRQMLSRELEASS
ncbi:MAG: ABC transporter ATP-binding protein [Actinobacteria bacterium]|nr:ABC transporter ATP-binding protein [Actinomycetota bacterium]